MRAAATKLWGLSPRPSIAAAVLVPRKMGPVERCAVGAGVGTGEDLGERYAIQFGAKRTMRKQR